MPTGLVSTYDLNAGTKLDMEDMIHLISPTDVPLQGGQGADGLTVLSTDTCNEKKVEWLDEELLLPKSTLAASGTTSEAVITVASGHGTRFSTGDEVLIGSATQERVRVTGYGSTADTLLVTRGFDSSTPGSIVTSETLTIIARVLAEGSDPERARSLDRSARYNMTQILGPTAIHVSGTENAVDKYGLTVNEFDKQVANRTKEEMILFEQTLLYGARIEDTSNEWHTMGGLTFFLTAANGSNIDTSTTTITEALLLAQMQASYDNGGYIDRLIVGSKTKRVISAWATSITVNVNRNERVRGQVVTSFESDFGTVTVVLDRWCRTSDAFGIARDYVTVCTLRPMQFERLAKTGDSEKAQIVGEKSARIRCPSHQVRFTALT